MSLPEVLARLEQLLPQPQPPVAAAPAETAAPRFAETLARARRGPGVPLPAAAAPYAAQIDDAARRNGLDPALLASVIEQESGFDPHATSAAGAQGLMQLMPSTAASLGVTNPYDPTQSIAAGARYLRGDLDRVGGDLSLALAAYNAGLGAVERYGGIPPYGETQRYVQQVLGRYEGLTTDQEGS